MIGGRQTALGFGAVAKTQVNEVVDEGPIEVVARPRALPPRLDADTAAAHGKLVLAMGDKAIWNKYAH
jgi:DNA polymerase-3 subunit epsilon